MIIDNSDPPLEESIYASDAMLSNEEKDENYSKRIQSHISNLTILVNMLKKRMIYEQKLRIIIF